MMKVSSQNNFIYPNYTQNNAQNSVKAKSPSFCGVQRLTHMNIGMMGEGFIGNVLLKNVTKGTEELVNVFKNFDCGNEKYFLKNNEGGTIGEIMLKINKYFDYNRFIYKFQRIFAMVQTRFEKRLTEFTNLINCSHRKAKPKLQKFVEKFWGDARPDTAAMAATASRNWHAEYCYLPESMYNNLYR